MEAGLALVRRIRSATDMILADRDSLDTADGYDRAHTLPLHRVPSVLGDRTGSRTSMSNNAIDSGGQVDDSPSPASELNAVSPDIAGRSTTPPRAQSTSRRSIASGLSTGNQSKAADESAAQKYSELEYEKCECKSIDTYARGIGRVAALQANSDHLAIFRRFRHSHTRTLIRLELEITELETRLCNLELTYGEDSDKKHFVLGTSLQEGDDEDVHQKTSKTLKEKLKEYGDLALNYSRMSALKSPHKRNHRSLFDYIVCKRPLAEPYREFVYAKDDFFCAVDCQNNLFEEQMQAVLRWLKFHWIGRTFQSKKETKMNTDRAVQNYSSSRILNFARVLSVCLAVGILLAPVLILFLVPMARGGMALTATAFLVLFAGSMSFLTNAKLEMVFIGTATYGAVLIMFLGNLREGKSGFVS